jgi:carbamoyl-phosphate synthase large subunit
MEIVYDLKDLKRYLNEAVKVSNDSPVLLDRFLDDAIEVDIDAICDGTDVVIGGIMEHIEQAGVHSGDSACSLPPYSLSKPIQDKMRQQVRDMALELGVIGLMNTQFAIKDDEVYLIEVNPRAARTVPFVSKATGVPLAKIAARVMSGKTLAEQGVTSEVIPPFYSVKEVVLPFAKFQGVDPLLGPEMRSTGEVMGVGETFEEAYAKANLGAGSPLPRKGKVLISVRESDKPRAIELVKNMVEIGYEIEATRGTATELYDAGIMSSVVNKMSEGRPNIVDAIKNGEYAYIINTTEGRQAITDSMYIRREALVNRVLYTTTMNAARATVSAHTADDRNNVTSVQELHARLQNG